MPPSALIKGSCYSHTEQPAVYYTNRAMSGTQLQPLTAHPENVPVGIVTEPGVV
jgi:hypothetical protein